MEPWVNYLALGLTFIVGVIFMLAVISGYTRDGDDGPP